MDRKSINAFKKLLLAGLASTPEGESFYMYGLFAQAKAEEFDDETVREALDELFRAGRATLANEPRKLWQTRLARGPKFTPSPESK